VLASGLAISGVFVAAAGWASSFWLLVVLLALAGGMGASVNAASARAVMQWFPAGQRGLALGLRQTAIPVGGALAALALPAVNGAGGLEASFVFLGAVCVASAAVAAVAIRERIDDQEPELDADDVTWTLRDSRLWVVCTGSGLYLFTQLALTSFLVLFLHDAHGLSQGEAAGVLAALQVGAVITRIGSGWISDVMRARIRPLRWIGLASAAGAILTAALADGPLALLLPVVVVAGAISMAWNGLSVTAAAELAGRSRSGAAIGFQQTMLAVIGLFVPAAFAYIVDVSSWRTGFALASIGPIAGWYMLGRLREISG
jgi:sugar phosphate permease